MSSKKILILSFFTIATAFAFNPNDLQQMNKNLDKYKEYLEEGTYAGFDKSLITPCPKSRYYTFKAAFEHFIKTNGTVIVELGTSRSFVHGQLPGCNCDDIKYWTPDEPKNWDWSAGFFTRVVSETLEFLSPEIHTIDISHQHINRCKIMTKMFEHVLHYHVISSLTFLANAKFNKKIDLLYIDTGDMTPIERTAKLQLDEAKIIVERDIISKNGIILIDDVKNQTPLKFGETSNLGKAKYSIPYFLSHGFEIVENEYQVILKRTQQ